MKKIISNLVLIFLCLIALKSNSQKDYCSSLRDSFSEFNTNKKDSLTALKFVSLFPKTFNDFYLVFGTNDGCLSDSSGRYFQLLMYSRTLITNEIFYKTLFFPCLGGIYETDGSGVHRDYKQLELFDLPYSSEHRWKYLKFLNEQSDNDLKSFFKYFYDEISKDSLNHYYLSYANIKLKYPRLFSFMLPYIPKNIVQTLPK